MGYHSDTDDILTRKKEIKCPTLVWSIVEKQWDTSGLVMKETLTKSLNMVVSERLLALLAEGAFVTTRHSSKRNRKLSELAEEC